jgi:hypothetical protein
MSSSARWRPISLMLSVRVPAGARSGRCSLAGVFGKGRGQVRAADKGRIVQRNRRSSTRTELPRCAGTRGNKLQSGQTQEVRGSQRRAREGTGGPIAAIAGRGVCAGGPETRKRLPRGPDKANQRLGHCYAASTRAALLEDPGRETDRAGRGPNEVNAGRSGFGSWRQFWKSGGRPL